MRTVHLLSLIFQQTAAIIRQEAPMLAQAEAGKSIVISDKGVSLEVPVSEPASDSPGMERPAGRFR